MEEGTRLRRTFWRFIRPRSEEIILYTLIAAILFVVALYDVAVSGGINIDTKELFLLLNQAANNGIATITAAIGDNKLLLFGFWFIVGAVVYILLWFIANVLIDSYNNIVISAAFVHPKSFHQSEYWAAILARTVLRTVAAIALISYTYFWFKALLPALEQAYKVSFAQLSAGSIINGIATTLTIILSLHICTIFYRIVRLSKDDDEVS